MKKALICPLFVLAALLLAGCTHSGPREVSVPVREACVDRQDVPPETPPAGTLPEDARQAADLLGAVVLTLRGEVRILRALIEPCTR